MVCLWDKVKWKTPLPIGETLIDVVAKGVMGLPKDGENTITLTAGGKSVTVTDKQFADAAKGIKEKNCTVCGSTTHDKGWHNLKQNKGK